MGGVFLCFPVAGTKHSDMKQLRGGNGLFSSYTSGSQSVAEGSLGKNWGRNWRKVAGLPSGSCLAHFLIQGKAHLRDGVGRSGLGSPAAIITNDIFSELAGCRPVWPRQVFSWDPFFPGDSGPFQADNKNWLFLSFCLEIWPTSVWGVEESTVRPHGLPQQFQMDPWKAM